MENQMEEPKKVSRHKTRRSMKISETTKHHGVKLDITRDQFHALVRKAAQPIKKSSESDVALAETSESRHSDDCNGTNTH